MPVLNLTEPTFDFNTIHPSSKLLLAGDSIDAYTDYHTNVGDMSCQEIINVSKEFSKINFVPNGFDVSSDTYAESEILLNVLRHQIDVSGFNFKNPETFLTRDVYTRPGPGPVLWVFGCSHSHGVGLSANEKTFGQIVADTINRPLMQITKPGSSLNWSFRHLINADIRVNDWVVWQITTAERVSIYNGVNTTEVQLGHTNDRSLLDVNTDDQIFFNHISMLNTGIQYLHAIKSQFLFLDITYMLDNSSQFYKYILEYSKRPEYCYKLNHYKDLGTDGQHAGPLSHNAIALSLLSRIQYNNE